jgi:lysophospholipase L1-like esterase
MSRIHSLRLTAFVLLLQAIIPAAHASRLVDNLKAGKAQVVVTYGTSLTAGGYWGTDTKNWLSSFNPGLVTFVNSGMSGKASNTGVANLQSRVLAHLPDAVFIEFAINDAAPYNSYDLDYGITPEKSRENLNTMIDAILAARPSCEIFIQTMNPPWDAPNGNQSATKRPRIAEYYEGYRQVAAERGLLLIDHHANWTQLKTSDLAQFQAYIPDGVHPSADGCTAIISPEIRRRLEVFVAVPSAPVSLTAVGADAQVSLAWPRVNDATSYTIKRATVSGGPYVTIASAVTDLIHVDTGLANDTPYYYVVTAANALGDGLPSAPVSATPRVAVAPIIKDNADETGVTFTGSWSIGTGFPGFIPPNYAYVGAGSTGTVRFTPTLPSAGIYAVRGHWNASINRATNTPFTITHANGAVTIPTNQQINHDTWVLLGTYAFNAGTGGHVSLTGVGANGLVLADAVSFTRKTPPEVSVVSTTATIREDTAETARFLITRRDTNDSTLTVRYTLSGTAQAGTDYTAPSGSITLPIGVDSAALTLTATADALSEGDETIVLTLTTDPLYSIPSSGIAETIIKDRPIDGWRFGYFSSAQRTNEAISGDAADPDGDGRKNLLEYALGTAPLQADEPPLVVEMTDGHLTMDYPRRLDAQGVVYTPEVSSDLVNWMSGTVNVDDVFVSDLGDGFSLMRAVDITPLSSEPRRFLRLRVTTP